MPTALRRLLLGLITATALLVAPLAAPAHAATEVESYLVDAAVAADGSLRVTATITPTGGAGEITQRFALALPTTGSREYRFAMEGVRVTRGGADAGARVRSEGDYQVVTMPVTDAQPLVLEYTVRGAALATQDSTTVIWRMLQGLDAGVRTFEATVDTPAPFSMIDCAAGPPGSPGACTWYSGGTHENRVPTFHDGPRGPGEVVQVLLRFPGTAVAADERVVQRWSLDRAFSFTPAALGLAAALAALGSAGLLVLRRRYHRDAEADVTPTVVGTFRPVGAGHSEFQVSDGIRPGEIGTLVDGTVDPVDVTATILDLATRGALRIRELPRASAFVRADWEFERREVAEPLQPWEQSLLDAVAPADGERVRVSGLGAVVADLLPTLRTQLFDGVVDRGWFTRRPDDTRGVLTRVGWVLLGLSVVAAAVLIALTPFGIAGLVLVALAAGFGFLAQETPARSRAGAGVLAGLGMLRGHLLTQPTHEMPPGREVAELSEVLPYAVVLGGTDRWLDGVAATDTDDDSDETDVDWYHGPQGWHLSDLPDSLRNFITTVEGSLVQR